MAKSPQVPASLAASLISLVIGGALGYYAQAFAPHPPAAVAAATAPAASSAAEGGGGRSRGSGGGGGFGGPQTPATELARTVRNLNTIEQVQGKGITHDQAAALEPILQKIQASPKLSDADAKKDADAIDKILSPDQHEALTTVQPQRGGRGGFGGGGGRGGGGRSGAAAGVGAGGPAGGDNENPFSGGRAKDALDGLIAAAKKV